MRRFPGLAALVGLLSLSGSLAPGAARAAWTHDPSSNLRVTSAPSTQANPAIAPDGAGGAFIVWADFRNSGVTAYDIYLQHVTKAGVNDPLWPVNGVAVVTLAGDQLSPVAVSDGAGGVIVAWEDHRGANWDIYAQRYNAAGTAAWTANGVALTTHSADEVNPVITADGIGGAFVAWTRHYSVTDYDPIVQHVLANGSIAAGYGSSGNDVDAAGSTEANPAICSDDSAGVWVAYETNASGAYNIRVARITSAGGTALWNVQVTNAAGDQVRARVCPDNHHGAFVVWTDNRSGTSDIYGSHVLANGAIGAGYSFFSDGLLLETSGNNKSTEALIPDNAGGCYLYWSVLAFFQVAFVTRLTPAGAFASGWTSNGIQLGEDSGGFAAISDGAGGSISIFAGYAASLSYYALGATRVTPSGSLSAGWASPYVDVSTTGAQVNTPVLASDGNSGAIFAWTDGRAISDFDIYAQRIERFGQLGNPEPASAGIKDIKNDQGGHVRVSWTPSYLDVDPVFGVAGYQIWRQAPASAAASAARAHHEFRTQVQGTQVTYWEQVGYQGAAQLPAYSFDAATTADSVGAGNPYTLFMVDAVTFGAPYWSSSPDSGYSVDNLAPVAPSPFTANYVPPNGTFLQWGANAEPDLAGYRLYRGAGNFTPSPANRIYDGVVPSYHDPTNQTFMYTVCSYDIHGNEAHCTTVQPAGTLAAGDALPAVVTLAPVAPNPLRGAGLFRYGLPRTADLDLAVFDAQGRRVRTLASGTHAAGWAELVWDGRGPSGEPAASGLYFVRLVAEGHRISYRFVRLQ